jgi:hypothetical protein
VQVLDAADPDAEPLTFQFDWRVNGQTVRLHSSSTASDVLDLSQPGLGDRGDLIELIVTASDGTASTSTMASLTVAASPSELYADYQLAVSQANQVYLNAVGAAVAWRDATIAATRQAAQTAADGYYGQYQATVAQAYQVYLLAQTMAYSAYQSTVAEADITEASAKASAKTVYFASSSAAGMEDQVTLTPEQQAALDEYLASYGAAEQDWVNSEQAAWNSFVAAEADAWSTLLVSLTAAHAEYQSAVAFVEANRLAQEGQIVSSFNQAYSEALASWQSLESNAWNTYLQSLPSGASPLPRVADPPAVPIQQLGGFNLFVQNLQFPNRVQGPRRPRGVISITPGSGSGAEGTEITVTVQRGFDANAGLRVLFNGAEVTILQNGNVVQPGNLRTDANGRATFTIRLDRNYPRFGRVEERGQLGYEIRVSSGAGQNTVYAYAHYIVTR